MVKGGTPWKWLLFLSALIAVGVAGFVGPTDGGAARRDVHVVAMRAPEAASSFGSFGALPVRETFGRARGDPFAPRDWAPPPTPPPQQASEAPPVPTAPPLPYRFAGTVKYDGMFRVVLAAGERVHLVKAGEVIDELYRVHAIAHDSVTLVYIPLGIEQQVAHVPGADARAPAQAAAPAQVPAESALPPESPLAAR